jgi:hypothetical protein
LTDAKLSICEKQLAVVREIMVMGHYEVGFILTADDCLRLVVDSHSTVAVQVCPQVVYYYLLLIAQFLQAFSFIKAVP